VASTVGRLRLVAARCAAFTLAAAGVVVVTALGAFAGVAKFPMRVKCASLAWHALKAAVTDDHAPVTTE